MSEFPKISVNPNVQARYERLRANGEAHGMAEVLATGCFPATKTDREFWSGRWEAGGGLHPAEFEHHKALAEAAGVSVTGKVYCRGLADYPGDPTAWVGDRGDVLRVAKEKSLRVSGAVEYDPGEREPMRDAPLGADIIENEVRGIMAHHPDADPMEVTESVILRRTGQVDEQPLLVQDIPPDAIGPDL